MPHPIVIYFSWLVVASAIALGVMGSDKRRATLGARRVPEARLHLLALLGGWPGTLLAMRLFKHKRRKAAFVRVFWLMVVAHLVVLALLVRLLR